MKRPRAPTSSSPGAARFDSRLSSVLRKAEELAEEQGSCEGIAVAWDPVGGRAVRIGSATQNPTNELWGALFAAESETFCSPRASAPVSSIEVKLDAQTKRTTHFVAPRIQRDDPYLLHGMPEWERRAQAALENLHDDTPHVFGSWIVYWMRTPLRVEDNVALLYAFRLARSASLPLVVFAFAESGRQESNRRKSGLASVENALSKLHVPLICFQGEFDSATFSAFGSLHIVVTDFDPGSSDSLRADNICPVLTFDSSFWCVRLPSALAEATQELCAERMHVFMQSLPILTPLSESVQRMLYCENDLQRVYLPPDLETRRANLVPSLEIGIEAAEKSVNDFLDFLASFKGNWKAERVKEIQDCVGAWCLLQYIESGSLCASQVLRQIRHVDSARRRVAFEVLVWGREQRILWAQNEGGGSQSSGVSQEPIIDFDDLVLNEDDLFFAAIHGMLIRRGVVHPLLLKHWLAALPQPRIHVARALLIRYSLAGWSFAVECAVRYELQLGPPTIGQKQQDAITAILAHQ